MDQAACNRQNGRRGSSDATATQHSTSTASAPNTGAHSHVPTSTPGPLYVASAEWRREPRLLYLSTLGYAAVPEAQEEQELQAALAASVSDVPFSLAAADCRAEMLASSTAWCRSRLLRPQWQAPPQPLRTWHPRPPGLPLGRAAMSHPVPSQSRPRLRAPSSGRMSRPPTLNSLRWRADAQMRQCTTTRGAGRSRPCQFESEFPEALTPVVLALPRCRCGELELTLMALISVVGPKATARRNATVHLPPRPRSRAPSASSRRGCRWAALAQALEGSSMDDSTANRAVCRSRATLHLYLVFSLVDVQSGYGLACACHSSRAFLAPPQ